MMRRTRGQVWSADYTIGLLLFLFALLLVVGMLFRTTLRRDSFSDVARSAESVGQRLMGPGYPLHWRADDALTAGLLTEGELSMRKAERLAAIADTDYAEGKRLLGTPYDYAVILRLPNGTIVPIGAACAIGNATEHKTPLVVPAAAAYYAGAAGGLNATLISLGAQTYSGDGLVALLSGLRSTDILIMEEPELSGEPLPYDGEKASALTAFVERGGTLLLIGDVGLAELGLNLSTLNGSFEAQGALSEDSVFNLSGTTLSGLPASAWALQRGAQARYEPLASLPDGRDFAARFSIGDGDVYYIGATAGTIDETGETLLAHLGSQLNATLSVESASCSPVELPAARNLVTTRRLVAYRGEILSMDVSVWER